jgi:hypothetical protein
MCELTNLQINKHKALQNVIVKFQHLFAVFT